MCWKYATEDRTIGWMTPEVVLGKYIILKKGQAWLQEVWRGLPDSKFLLILCPLLPGKIAMLSQSEHLYMVGFDKASLA